MEVDRTSAVPPYLQLAAQLAAAIRAGQYEGRLPSAVGISQTAGVAVLTARRALQEVVTAGYAYVAVGMGTYVRDRSDWPEG